MKLLTIEQLSEKLGKPLGTIYQWTSQKKIPYIKLYQSLRFDEFEIDKWLENKRVKEILT